MSDKTENKPLIIETTSKSASKTQWVTLRVGDDERSWLNEVTTKHSISISDVVRGLIAAARTREIEAVIRPR
ncbi:hypothetical protein AB6Q56_07790 [Dechloromonas sp. ARDL1]|uniref:hypothetical protein n=1 Tax=Dechloromonas sp. ARDL1 TaxID=3322121 RepID=UPI003DA6EEF2